MCNLLRLPVIIHFSYTELSLSFKKRNEYFFTTCDIESFYGVNIKVLHVHELWVVFRHSIFLLFTVEMAFT